MELIQEHEDDPGVTFDKNVVNKVLDYALCKTAKEFAE